MLQKRPIRVKVLIGLGLLLLIVAVLASGGLYSAYSYRGLVRDMRSRAAELPVASQLSQQVTELQLTLTKLRGLQTYGYPAISDHGAPSQAIFLRDEFTIGIMHVETTLSRYRELLEDKLREGSRMADNRSEWETVHKIENSLAQVRRTNAETGWFSDMPKIEQLEFELECLQELSVELPSHLHDKLGGFAEEVRLQYRSLLVGMAVTSVLAALFLMLFMKLFYKWVFQPLGVLVAGSREVAAGRFDYRIKLHTHDEMSELADAMNNMTARFQAIRDDLDNQVAQRTREVIRNEQLAGVGFLAAGVAHEINNPLASIAMCAESLESRVRSLLDEDDGQHEVIGNYLRMIQTEAFRCKEITDGLLDFSRSSETKRQQTELGELVGGVIEMLAHLGKYRGKRIEFKHDEVVTAAVNPQEIKQVVLNLLTNALDSCDEGGHVDIHLARCGHFAELTVTDDGQGMEPDVLQHIFEPFFTRRRSGQGTGLGLSITHRIISEHGGDIQATSGGTGRGATFRVRLPLERAQREEGGYRRAA
ncbi:MAG: HAMP domain-containing histidine kinase [Pirellulales bacterium]|nr:HAMP domain-containing histidine kinase [Pirellulales bacterium]